MTALPRVHGITLDVNHLENVEFWGELLGLAVLDRLGAYVWFEEIIPGVEFILQQVDEPRTAKNRMHLELESAAPNDLVDRVLALGGHHLADIDEPEYALTVMADPEGNQFCVSRRPSPALASARSLSSPYQGDR